MVQSFLDVGTAPRAAVARHRVGEDVGVCHGWRRFIGRPTGWVEAQPVRKRQRSGGREGRGNGAAVAVNPARDEGSWLIASPPWRRLRKGDRTAPACSRSRLATAPCRRAALAASCEEPQAVGWWRPRICAPPRAGAGHPAAAANGRTCPPKPSRAGPSSDQGRLRQRGPGGRPARAAGRRTMPLAMRGEDREAQERQGASELPDDDVGLAPRPAV
jgi:hypothetical protein